MASIEKVKILVVGDSGEIASLSQTIIVIATICIVCNWLCHHNAAISIQLIFVSYHYIAEKWLQFWALTHFIVVRLRLIYFKHYRHENMIRESLILLYFDYICIWSIVPIIEASNHGSHPHIFYDFFLLNWYLQIHGKYCLVEGTMQCKAKQDLCRNN